jgi:hypothetical protein
VAKKLTRAHSITTRPCPGCGGPVIQLLDKRGWTFAEAHITDVE